jgi:hypothetical protein
MVGALPANLCPRSRSIVIGFRRIAADHLSHPARIDVNDRLASRGNAISSEKENGALHWLSADLHSTLAGKLVLLGSWASSVLDETPRLRKLQSEGSGAAE